MGIRRVKDTITINFWNFLRPIPIPITLGRKKIKYDYD
jgi:hypothetical protein